MILHARGIYLDGSCPPDRRRGPARAPLALPRGVDAVIRVLVTNESCVPVDLAAAGVSCRLTIAKDVGCCATPVTSPPQPIIGAVNLAQGPGVVDFALPATALKRVEPGLLYYDVVVVGLSAPDSIDEVVATSALRLLPAVGA